MAFLVRYEAKPHRLRGEDTKINNIIRSLMLSLRAKRSNLII